jgi:hypothetical protein
MSSRAERALPPQFRVVLSPFSINLSAAKERKAFAALKLLWPEKHTEWGDGHSERQTIGHIAPVCQLLLVRKQQDLPLPSGSNQYLPDTLQPLGVAVHKGVIQD